MQYFVDRISITDYVYPLNEEKIYNKISIHDGENFKRVKYKYISMPKTMNYSDIVVYQID